MCLSVSGMVHLLSPVLWCDNLQQSVNGPDAAAFVPGLIRCCIIHLFVLGTN